MSTDANPNLAGALAVGALAALVASLPASLRASGQGASLPLALILLAGAAAITVGVTAACLRALSPWPRSLTALIVAVLLALPVLAIFARVLKTATHHRPLGGVTFAVLGALVVLGCLVLAGRAVSWSSTRPRRLAVMGVAALAGAFGARLLLPLLTDASLRGIAIDAAVLVVAIAVAAAWTPPPALRSRPVALGMFGALAGAAVVLALASPATAEIARGVAPVLHGPLWVVSN
ncbi:MAG: hypothetical protein KF718_20715 [Polyangiaceae bacterium]|nr:hypothetical protein [Polyangiaceae bacterium]